MALRSLETIEMKSEKDNFKLLLKASEYKREGNKIILPKKHFKKTTLLEKFKVYNAVLLTIGAMLYTSLEMIYN